MNKVDFTFVIPNSRWHRSGAGRYWNHIPYPEAILTAVLRQNGYTVSHIDANVSNMTREEFRQSLESVESRVFGISAISVEYRDGVHQAFEVIKREKPDSLTVLGGVYPSLSPNAARKDQNIDFIVISEGERRIVQLMSAIDNSCGFDVIDGLHFRNNGDWRYVPHKFSSNVSNLDDLPFPDYDDYDYNKLFYWSQKYTQNFQFRQLPMTIMMTSRGCPYKCTYCGAGKAGNPINDGVRGRSPEGVLAEVDFMVEKYGIREIVFVDDSLLIPHARSIEIFKGIADRRKAGIDLVWKSNNLDLRHLVNDQLLYWMKESGCYQISVSLESGSPDTFKRMNRKTNLPKAISNLEKLRAQGFDEIASNFIIGVPGDTWDDILRTFEFADEMINGRNLLDYALFSIATPLPGTEMAEQAREQGYLPENFDPDEFYGFGKGVITTEHFAPDELQMKRAMEWDRINFRTDRRGHHEKIAKMLGLSTKELSDWRQETRRCSGVQVTSVDNVDLSFTTNPLPNLFHATTSSGINPLQEGKVDKSGLKIRGSSIS